MADESVIAALNTAIILPDLLWLIDESDQRCLFECSRWCREIIYNMSDSLFEAYEVSINDDKTLEFTQSTSKVTNSIRHSNTVEFAKLLIQNKEYRRAKFFLSKIQRRSLVERFLYYFSWYMISVRTRQEDDASDCDRVEEFVDTNLSELLQDINSLKQDSPELFDCFLNYLHGLILKDSKSTELAQSAFFDAIHLDHRCWPAWEQLSKISDIFFSVKMEKEKFGSTWQCSLYVSETLFNLQLFLCAIDKYGKISQTLGSSPYFLCQIATAQSDLQEHDSSISSFQRVRKMDPYRIEQMNYFSDSLYIRQNLIELSNIAKFFFESHKFNWETCCIVANYYSARGNPEGHEMASNFLKRAARMCPSNTSIWVLLGHELMETKRHQSAVTAYRRATVIDPLCYRAWYGLGQLYEILKLPAVALYYYQQAHKCKPADSRMLIALGVIFSRLNRIPDAEKCFKKAFQIGDVEGNALTNLARLYEGQKDNVTAAKAYEAYLGLYNEELVGDLEQLAAANQFLARYYLTLNDLDKAYTFAQKCLNYNISKEEGFRILRLIMNQRSAMFVKPAPSTSAAILRKAVPTIIATPLGNLDESNALETPFIGRNLDETALSEDEIVEDTNVGNEDDMITSDDDEIEISF